jgi:hypothetical protein
VEEREPDRLRFGARPAGRRCRGRVRRAGRRRATTARARAGRAATAGGSRLCQVSGEPTLERPAVSGSCWPPSGSKPDAATGDQQEAVSRWRARRRSRGGAARPGDVADRVDVRVARARRRGAREQRQRPAVPGSAQHRRERVDLARGVPEHRAELGLDDQQRVGRRCPPANVGWAGAAGTPARGRAPLARVLTDALGVTSPRLARAVRSGRTGPLSCAAAGGRRPIRRRPSPCSPAASRRAGTAPGRRSASGRCR